ncbi:hypothetical protein EZV73_04415 [Acidaminobacter sp. JC074]|uniref:zinc dependent phospholipase C family protein n=1 Tax=Acidaminobacter sp. JC074 TaxID=2530199 RepID=UPI001F0D1DDF|nr:zinc dependent phospholipase C family protein [Acidaminobacter sp. JC074]MCH4886797.1 hypothetical protein [Acidaminobacter sp. JC074]
MPDVLTHMVCSEETLNHLNEDIKEILINNKHIYHLGAQGPDLFFYYKPLSGGEAKDIRDYGSKLHQDGINDFFLAGANRIKHAIAADPIGFFKSEKKDTALHKEFAYISGFFSHYAMDTIGHPFIFYFSGVDSGYNHKYFECILDTLISDIYDGKKLKVHNTGKAIELTNSDNKLISLFLSKVVRDSHKISVNEEIISKCIKDMGRTLKAMYDPMKIKRHPFKWIDKIKKADGKITTATFPAKFDPKVDHLNIQKKEWFHPCDDNLVYKTSFLELISSGSKRSSDLIKVLSYYMINTVTEKQFLDKIGNLKYDTGLNYECEMKNDNIIVHYK